MTLSVELSGLQSAQTNIDTIGNNIANVSTTGFKSTTANFGAVYATSLGGASSNNTPGLGAAVTSLSQLFTEGSISQTGNPLDVAVNGDGFLQVQSPTGIAYTRDGSLQTDANGFLTTNTGNVVMGFAPPASGTASTTSVSGPLVPLQISTANLPAAATTQLTINVNLPSTDAPINTTTTPFSVTNRQSYSESSSTTVYDSLGTPNTLTTYFTQASGSGAPPQWQTHWTLSGSNGAVVASGAGATLTFNSSGTLTAGSGTIAVGALPDGAAALNINQSFSGSTLSALNFGINAIANDGNSGGVFAGVQINSNGNVIAQYSNGATKTAGTIALASFANPNGLTPISNNMWLATQNSGPAITNAPGSGGLGTLTPNAVEGSNVDLSTELVNLIVAQQAYQANVQGISVDQQNIQRLLTVQ